MDYNETDKTAILEKDGKSLTKIEVGDSKQFDIFYPQTKFLYWDNECNFSVRLKDTDYSLGTLRVLPEKVEWEKDGRIARFYEKPDNAFEFEVELTSKPASNVLEFTIQTKEFNFFYQAPLNEEPDVLNDPLIVSATETQAFDKDGNAVLNRPEHVVGSYAVYHKTKKHNRVGGKSYATGKAFHIYRPFVEDSGGKTEWCELNIDEASGLMTVTIPQDFLDTAVYPVIVDPTFGDTSFGASNGTRGANTMPSNEIGDATEDGTVTSVSLALDGNGVGTVNVKGVLLDHVDGTPNSDVIVTNGVSPSAVLPSSAGGSYTTINYSSSPSITNGLDYAVGAIADATIRYYYDNTATEAFFDDTNNYTTPQDIISGSTGTTRDMSYYITYTAGGGGGGGTNISLGMLMGIGT